MAGVRLTGVTKRFAPSTVAVDRLDLDVVDGEFLVVLGPSGCGKSTVLRLIAGLERPDAGSIAIGDRCVDDVPAEQRDAAMVFQSYALYPHMSVRRNIAFSLRPLGLGRAERDDAVEHVAEQLDLTDVLERKPRELSGGQQQRVALGRALVRRPCIFLMDEPLSNLDAQLRTRTRAELVRLQRQIGTTVVYVTHDQVEALTMADRIAVMGNGRLQQLGTPEEVYDRPANTFVAGFVGTPPMNLWPASVDVRGVVSIGGTVVSSSSDPAVRDRDVIVGIRPESVQLLLDRTIDRTDAGPADDGMVAVVDWVEDLGHEHLIRGTLESGSGFTVRWAGEAGPPALGRHVRVCPTVGALHMFDTASGARIA
jgi:multiple sugar transport system ATP-binding protein